ncbi:YhfC family intramembrane metalloprotease [Bacillus sp. SY8(2021)]|uniref:YhfC family intramembrane metalloprotease n=1 Tax=Bacillus arachidis TaxID=2819290 RepID=A0ABS3P5Z1_9BACI|nr:YhfC family intramembrane metalloprotease [Bacillus arachidis]
MECDILFLFAIVIDLSAGFFEEVTRFIAMRFFMKQRDWQSEFLFGARLFIISRQKTPTSRNG